MYRSRTPLQTDGRILIATDLLGCLQSWDKSGEWIAQNGAKVKGQRESNPRPSDADSGWDRLS